MKSGAPLLGLAKSIYCDLRYEEVHNVNFKEAEQQCIASRLSCLFFVSIARQKYRRKTDYKEN